MSPEFVAARPETRAAAGRAGWWGLDTANPLVAGTAGAARAAVDVALTTADLVLGGERAAYGLCRPPGHHAARSMAGGYCFFNNAAIAAEAIARATGERGRDPRRRLPPRQRDPADLLAPRRRPVRLAPRRPGAAVPVLPRPGRRDRRRGGERREPQHPAAGRAPTTRPIWPPSIAASRRSPPRPASHRRLARLRHVRPRPDRRLRPHDRGLPRVRPTDGGARSAARDPPGGRLPPAVARRERPGLAARRGGPAVRAAAGGRVRRAGSTVSRDGAPSGVPSPDAQPTDLPAHVRAHRRRDRDRDRRGAGTRPGA